MLLYTNLCLSFKKTERRTNIHIYIKLQFLQSRDFVIWTSLFVFCGSVHFFLWILVTSCSHFLNLIQLCFYPSPLCCYWKIYYSLILYTQYILQLISKSVKRGKENKCAFILSFKIIGTLTSTHFFGWIWITAWGRLLSVWKTSFHFSSFFFCSALQTQKPQLSYHQIHWFFTLPVQIYWSVLVHLSF